MVLVDDKPYVVALHTLRDAMDLKCMDAFKASEILYSMFPYKDLELTLHDIIEYPKDQQHFR